MYVYAKTRIYTCVCMCVCVRACVYTYMQTHIYTRVCACVCLIARARACVRVCAYIMQHQRPPGTHCRKLKRLYLRLHLPTLNLTPAVPASILLLP